ncbi:MAG: DNA-directed RNA polymerase subunit omega [bacterium]
MDYKKTKAPVVATPYNIEELEKETGNIFESINIISKRAAQINAEMKIELDKKLEEFAYYIDNFEEIFENREQIEVSKYYEKLPKPTLIALQEFLDDEIYYRNPNKS